MTTYTIKHINGTELWSGEAASMRDALEKAVFARAYLAGANLARAYLAGANLDGANLDGAYLAGANLAGANLAGANLVGANLVGASLVGAYLVGASLVGASLVGASLVGANLDGASLDGASLAGAKGLDYCIGGWALEYGWTCLRRPGQGPTLRYGCETHDLAEWTEGRIVALSAKHEPSAADRYAAMLRGLVAWCRTHDALWPVADAAPEVVAAP